MLNTIFRAIVLICCAVTISNAQLPKASDFLPLQVGNIWQHQRADGFGVAVQSEVVSDTLLGDTLTVYKVRFSAFQDDPPVPDWFGYRNYNSDSTVVYSYEDFPSDPLNPSINGFTLLDTRGGFGGTWEVFLGDIFATAAITDTGTISFFGEQRKWVGVNLIEAIEDTIKIVEGYHFKFIDGIGISRADFDTLIYAKIDGKEFGSPITTAIDERDPISLPGDFSLQVYPNPARAQVTFYLKKALGGSTDVAIYDILGRKVRSFKFDGFYQETKQINWDGRDARNQVVASGSYFVTVKAGHLYKTHKFIYLR